MQFVRDADPTALAPHAELFRKHVSLDRSLSLRIFNIKHISGELKQYLNNDIYPDSLAAWS